MSVLVVSERLLTMFAHAMTLSSLFTSGCRFARTKEGIEYDVEQRGHSLYIIRKQDRQKRREGVMEGTTTCDTCVLSVARDGRDGCLNAATITFRAVQQLAIYYCVYRFNRENPAISTLDILRAPDLGAILNFRMVRLRVTNLWHRLANSARSKREGSRHSSNYE